MWVLPDTYLAFGLTLLTMAYVIGPISGCHINPAVTIGLWAGGRFPGRKIVPYIIAQIFGGIAGAGIAYAIASGKTGFDISTGPGANGYGIHSPSGYSMWAGFLVEVVLTLGFVFIVLGSTDIRVPKGFGPIPVGLAFDAGSFDRHTCNKHVCKPGSQSGTGCICRWMGFKSIMAVLVGTFDRSNYFRINLSVYPFKRRRSTFSIGKVTNRFKIAVLLNF